jgi:serine protease Do
VIDLKGETIVSSIMLHGNAKILDEVLTLGFPQIPGFMQVMVAENATVSGRFTASKGTVASTADNIWTKDKLYLITAKIKGGNSGGPVINRHGEVIGVSIQQPIGEGAYDELGYGVVVPISFVIDDIYHSSNLTPIKPLKFFDYSD